MIRATIVLQEFMDGGQIENTDVEITLFIVPRVHEVRVVGSADFPGMNNFDGFDTRVGSSPPMPLKPELMLRPHLDLAEKMSKVISTGSQSFAIADFQADEAFDRVRGLRINGGSVSDVVAVISVSVDSNEDGAPRQINFFYGLLDEDGPDLLSVNDTITRYLSIDLAKSIVGETTSDEVTLWFNLHGEIIDNRNYVCEISRIGSQSGSPSIELPVLFGTNNFKSKSAVVTAEGLEEGTEYHYSLYLRPVNNNDSGAGRILARGNFTTCKSNSDELSFVFGSCHYPGKDSSLERWLHLAARTDYDFMMLIGDQIYGDNIKALGNDWFERYENRYHQLWTYWPMREVMRRTPVYMILDDHEITDDFGTVPLDTIEEEAMRTAGLQLYKEFQESHGPARSDNDTHYYSFNRGPASFFMLDNRTQRSIPPDDQDFPILGEDQMTVFREWSHSPETRDADIIFLVSPVPVAWLPVEKLRELLRDFETSATDAGAGGGALIGAAIGAGVGFLLGGPAGAAVGASAGANVGGITGQYVGHDIAEGKLEDNGLGNLTDRDLADMWTLEGNQPDLVNVLDVLYDLANDIQEDGTRGARPRAVFILGGDVHSGAMHLIRSNKTEGDSDHRKNPSILQVTSSAISQKAADDKLYAKIIKGINPDVEIGALTLASNLPNGFDTDEIISDVFDNEHAIFPLDDQLGKNYIAEFSGLLGEHNFGRFHIERINQERRVYRFFVSVEGASDALVQYFDIDLDAPGEIKYQSLIGQVLAAEGQVTFLRVNEIGAGFGDTADHLDAEVIVKLDNHSGESFGFQLRRDANEKTHTRMLDVLRGAFNKEQRVHLEYSRTGRTTGQVIRVSLTR